MHPDIPSVTVKTIQTPFSEPIYYTGEELDKGPMPAFFYFALSGPDSLCLDPYNQVAAFLSNLPMRVFSITIPFHGEGFDKFKAMEYWADQLNNNTDFFTPFIDTVRQNIQFLIQNNLIDTHHLAIGGLSRGGLFALQIAALIPEISHLLLFAPVTDLTVLKEFAPLNGNHILQKLNPFLLANTLKDKSLRIYMGNRDVRVQTQKAFEFLQALTEEAYQHRIRSPRMEMMISPSIGLDGHGTPPQIFYDGANWIKNNLLDNS